MNHACIESMEIGSEEETHQRLATRSGEWVLYQHPEVGDVLRRNCCKKRSVHKEASREDDASYLQRRARVLSSVKVGFVELACSASLAVLDFYLLRLYTTL